MVTDTHASRSPLAVPVCTCVLAGIPFHRQVDTSAYTQVHTPIRRRNTVAGPYYYVLAIVDGDLQPVVKA